jgi:hypothetical protein
MVFCYKKHHFAKIGERKVNESLPFQRPACRKSASGVPFFGRFVGQKA